MVNRRSDLALLIVINISLFCTIHLSNQINIFKSSIWLLCNWPSHHLLLINFEGLDFIQAYQQAHTFQRKLPGRVLESLLALKFRFRDYDKVLHHTVASYFCTWNVPAIFLLLWGSILRFVGDGMWCLRVSDSGFSLMYSIMHVCRCLCLSVT